MTHTERERKPDLFNQMKSRRQDIDVNVTQSTFTKQIIYFDLNILTRIYFSFVINISIDDKKKTKKNEQRIDSDWVTFSILILLSHKNINYLLSI